ncbi:MAG: fumarylacetoacetate hydrolase family protein [Chloroflexi bacterium]|nr:fumarylacetoacetate hydrolase family protein [Chloroflexota bacterium]
MQFVRYSANGKTSYGILKGERIQEVSGNIFGRHQKTGKSVARAKAKLLTPCKPGKLIAIGLNYKSHIGARPAPVKPEMFLKTPTSLLDPEGEIIIPRNSGGNVHFEGELVIVMRRKGKRIAATDAKDYIFGYTCGNDVSERDWQRGDLQWARAKSSDTFSPLGPAIATDVDPRNLKLQTRVNGKVMQEQTTSDLVFDVYEIVAQASEVMTLEPGDVIYTGTPGHTEKMNPGDVVEVEIEGIGVLRNTVKAEV